MTYENKIERARQLVEEHNQALPESPVDFEKFFSELKKAGGTSEETLKACSFEELADMGLPKLLARRVAAIFRESDDSSSRRPVISSHRVQGMSVAELVTNYDPREAENPVGKRLTELSKSKPCIVFNGDGTVNIESSVQLINEIRDDYPAREGFAVDGIPQPLYKIGERLVQLGDENPLYPGRLLRPGEECDQTNRSWEGISHTLRVLLHLAVTRTHELRIESIQQADAAMDLALAEDGEKKTRRLYPNASILFDDLKSKGTLPTLKIARGGLTSGQKSPFAIPSAHWTS